MTFISIINYQLLFLQDLPLDMIIFDQFVLLHILTTFFLRSCLILFPQFWMFTNHTSMITTSLSKLHVQHILTLILQPLQQQVTCITQNISPYPSFPIDLIVLQSDILVSTFIATFMILASHMWNVHVATLQATYFINLGNKDACCIIKICCFFFPQNNVYCIILSFLFHKIFTVHVKGMLKFKCPPKSFNGQTSQTFLFHNTVSHISKPQNGHFFLCRRVLNCIKRFLDLFSHSCT
jgi:hypothetical protein